MSTRILVLGAGGPAGVNFIRSLRQGDGDYWISAWDENPYHLQWPEADSTYLAPAMGPDLLERLRGYCDVHSIDLVYAQPDPLVRWLGDVRHMLSAATFLPDQDAIVTCQDKQASLEAWERAGLRSGSVEIDGVQARTTAADTFGYPYWLRATEGAGGRGSTLVEDRYQVEGWITYWRARGVPWRFIAEEYLPGRNLAWMSVWHEGDLVSSTARERLEYIYPGASPSGITGTSAVCRSIAEDEVNSVAMRSVLAIDPNPHGAYCVDLKEDAEGFVRPTEVNPGRFFTVCNFATALGANLPELYVNLALDKPGPSLPQLDAAPAGWIWARHIDCPAVLSQEARVAVAA